MNDTEIFFGSLSMSNPHAVINVDDIESIAVGILGKSLESHLFFPEHANIGFMQIIDRQTIKLRVYERGVGETLACGSGACAAIVIGIEQGLLDKENISVQMPGGKLFISWAGRGHSVFMTGSATSVFEGQIVLND
jgi:diaminopimelate epimerase